MIGQATAAEDAVLLEAERQLAELRSSDGDIWPLVDVISHTAPQTLAGAAVKLRLLCSDIGILAGHSDEDETSLRQVLAFVEEMARRVAPG